MHNGFLISFEGGEACGKSTQVKKFVKFLEEKSLPFLLVREPGGTDVGENIRQILLHSKADLSSQTEFLLFSASRSHLIEKVVRPALAEGKIVIMDRFFDSSFAYQGYAGALDLKAVKNITTFAIGKNFQPALTFLLDLSYEDGMKRKSADKNLKNLDRMESKGKAYHDAVRAGYLNLAKKNKKRIVVVDASKSVEAVFADIVAEFERRYN